MACAQSAGRLLVGMNRRRADAPRRCWSRCARRRRRPRSAGEAIHRNASGRIEHGLEVIYARVLGLLPRAATRLVLDRGHDRRGHHRRRGLRQQEAGHLRATWPKAPVHVSAPRGGSMVAPTIIEVSDRSSLIMTDGTLQTLQRFHELSSRIRRRPLVETVAAQPIRLRITDRGRCSFRHCLPTSSPTGMKERLVLNRIRRFFSCPRQGAVPIN